MNQLINKKNILKKFTGTGFKVKQHGMSNKFEVENEDVKVLFSYNTPVAFKSKCNGVIHRTDQLFSPTTYKHIYEWVGKDKSKCVPQKEIEAAVKTLEAYGKAFSAVENTTNIPRGKTTKNKNTKKPLRRKSKKSIIIDMLKNGVQTRESLARNLVERGLNKHEDKSVALEKEKLYVSVILHNLKIEDKLKDLPRGKYSLR